MNWYAAHVIMYVKFKDGVQDKYPFWENVILIEAGDSDEAFAKAEERAKENEGDYGGSFTWEGRPAIWCFAGIRKLLTCQNYDERPSNGTEVTYSEMEVSSQEDFSKLLNGESVPVVYT